MKINKLLIAGLLCGAPLLASAQVNVGIGINLGGFVREAPPPPQVEYYGPRPGPDFVWVGGHWRWEHHRWIWVGGRWDRRPGYVWSAGHWDQSGGGWVWVEGRWVLAGPPPAVVYAPASSPAVVYTPAPPAPIVETIGFAPGPDYFWIGGRWNWVGGRWGWIPGRWDRHPHFHPGGGWVAGHWDHRGPGYIWVEGNWR